jgi:leader peptidase (prepilin peptidase)/N-methyltransferase
LRKNTYMRSDLLVSKAASVTGYLHFMAGLFAHPAGAVLLGLLLGSFLNMLAYRLPLMLEQQWWTATIEQLRDRPSWREHLGSELPIHEAQVDAAERALGRMRPVTLLSPSACPHCGHVIRWHENIPMLSWVLLRGRCSACSQPIHWRYPAGEALCAALCGAFAWTAHGEPVALAWVGFVCLLLAAAMIDLRTMVLPDAITLSALWVGLLLAAAKVGTVDLTTAVMGAAAGYASMRALAQIYARVAGQEGMGGGDMKLMAAVGAWLGAPALIGVWLVAGTSSVLARLLPGGCAPRAPFGPHIVAAAMAVALVRAPVQAWLGLSP